MAKKQPYNHDTSRSIHTTVSQLHEAGIVSTTTMRKFNKLCLAPVRLLEPKEIKSLREQVGVSQAVFAQYLNVTVGMLSKWERGEKKPVGTALKLLHLVEKKGLDILTF